MGSNHARHPDGSAVPEAGHEVTEDQPDDVASRPHPTSHSADDSEATQSARASIQRGKRQSAELPPGCPEPRSSGCIAGSQGAPVPRMKVSGAGLVGPETRCPRSACRRGDRRSRARTEQWISLGIGFSILSSGVGLRSTSCFPATSRAFLGTELNWSDCRGGCEPCITAPENCTLPGRSASHHVGAHL